MFITGLGTAVPPHRYTQREIWAAFQAAPQFARLTDRSRAILRKVLTGDNGISARHASLDDMAKAFDLSPDVLQERFTVNAPTLATNAALQAMQRAGISPQEVDGLVISTCTGYLCPGLTSYVSERLKLRSGVTCLDLVGQGCGAALPNLHAADTLIQSGRARHALSVCVEVCSAAFYLDDDPGVLISACLFADGAAAAVVSAEPAKEKRSVKWNSFHTVLKPESRDELRFEHRGGMLRNVLKPSVPKLAAYAADELLSAALTKAGRTREDIRAWIWHAGGRDILLALREHLGLSDDDFKHSAAVLRDYGNISSPSVLFVLDATLRANAPPGLWWMASFGAGFSCHGAMLEVS